MLYRSKIKELEEWKNRKDRKALCILGARQIGKTTLVRNFAEKHYSCFVELNFLSSLSARSIFAKNLDAVTLIENISAYAQKKLIPGKTLILFDEIQECPEARTAIKFLVEDGRFDYIETGSLLGARMKEIKSYPVGFETITYMYPMDFYEFLIASGMPDTVLDLIEKSYIEKKPVAEATHEVLLKWFYRYLVVGGMPHAVQTYVDTHDIARVIAVQRDIMELYRFDITQYASDTDRPKITDILDALPSQLNDKNRRFIVSSVAAKAKMNRYEDSFNWLRDAGIAYMCTNVTEPRNPLKINEKRNLFKLFMNDTGLLSASSFGNVQFDLLKGNVDINLGSILENAMADLLKSNGFDIHYFDTKKYGEVDFVLQNGKQVDLIEIKSGNDYKKHNALDKVRSVTEFTDGKSVVFCKGNVEVENEIIYLPWYMVIFYKPLQMQKTYIDELSSDMLWENL